MIGGPNLRYVRVEPPLLQGILSAYCVCLLLAVFGSACSEWSPGLRYFIIFSIFLSSPPPDGPSTGTESNLPVSHPTAGMKISDYASCWTRWASASCSITRFLVFSCVACCCSVVNAGKGVRSILPTCLVFLAVRSSRRDDYYYRTA